MAKKKGFGVSPITNTIFFGKENKCNCVDETTDKNVSIAKR